MLCGLAPSFATFIAAPCRMRAAMKVAKLGARPHSMEAMVNTAMALQKRLRAPTRSASQPEAVIPAATASM